MMCNYIFQVVTYERAKRIKVKQSDLESIYQDFVYGSRSYDKDRPTNDIFSLNIISSPDMYKKHREAFDAYFNRFIDKPWFDLYESVFAYRNTWDNYSLAVAYLFMIDDMYMENPDLSPKIASYVKELEKIVYCGPQERPSLVSTISSMKSLLAKS
jgi:hypothetical protein